MSEFGARLIFLSLFSVFGLVLINVAFVKKNQTSTVFGSFALAASLFGFFALAMGESVDASCHDGISLGKHTVRVVGVEDGNVIVTRTVAEDDESSEVRCYLEPLDHFEQEPEPDTEPRDIEVVTNGSQRSVRFVNN